MVGRVVLVPPKNTNGEDKVIWMFNRELFYTLCDKYGVEFSDKYDKPMLKTEDGLRELVEQDVKDIFSKRQKAEQ